MNEMKIGQHVEHPFLILMRESFETQGFYCMVFECTYPLIQIAQGENCSTC